MNAPQQPPKPTSLYDAMVYMFVGLFGIGILLGLLGAFLFTCVYAVRLAWELGGG